VTADESPRVAANGSVPAVSTPARRVGGLLLIVLAASLWGTSGVLRSALAVQLPAASVVFHEHLLLTLFTLPWLPRAIRTFRGLAWTARLAVVVIGVGASAVATTLFTAAFRYGDPTGPLLLQKLQPVIVVLAAAVVLRERPGRRFVPLAVVAILGGYLVSFPDPTSVGVQRLAPALLALAAATLWAGGTVLGRLVAPSVPAMQLTALRFSIGLPASLVVAVVLHGGSGLRAGRDDLVPLLLLALGPGLLAMSLYYRGLAHTPAAVATLGELAFPLTAVTLGAAVAGRPLGASQAFGALALVGAITLLALGSRARPLVRPGRRGAPVPAAL
jgi:drug/metabolite transporter, DME family